MGLDGMIVCGQLPLQTVTATNTAVISTRIVWLCETDRAGRETRQYPYARLHWGRRRSTYRDALWQYLPLRWAFAGIVSGRHKIRSKVMCSYDSVLFPMVLPYRQLRPRQR